MRSDIIYIYNKATTHNLFIKYKDPSNTRTILGTLHFKKNVKQHLKNHVRTKHCYAV